MVFVGKDFRAEGVFRWLGGFRPYFGNFGISRRPPVLRS